MDCNLKKMAIFFKFILYIVGKSLKTDLKFVLPLINPLIFSFRCSNSNFMLEKRRRVLCQKFKQFGQVQQNRRDSASLKTTTTTTIKIVGRKTYCNCLENDENIIFKLILLQLKKKVEKVRLKKEFIRSKLLSRGNTVIKKSIIHSRTAINKYYL